MALTRNDFTGDGVTTVYDVAFSLGFLQQSDIFVSLDSNEHTNQIGYSFLNATQVVLDAPVTNGVGFNIRRVVDRSQPINDYEEGAILRENNLDDSFVQSLMILQEIEDGYLTASGTLILLDDLDMSGNQILNLGEAVLAGDAINYGQVVELLAAGGFATVIPLVQPRQQGDGSTTVFSAPPSTQFSASAFFVHLDGVTQRPVTDYSIDTSGNCVFVEAPELNVDIDITFFSPSTLDTHAREFVHNSPTLLIALANVKAEEGDSVNLKARSTGNGGGATWDYVDINTVTPEGQTGYGAIHACTGNTNLALVLRVVGVSIDAFGASPTNTPETNQGAIQVAIDKQVVTWGLLGIYQHSGNFTGKSNLEFTGEEGFTLQCKVGYPLENQITFAEGVTNVKIHNVIFDMQNTINAPTLSSETLENSLDFKGCTTVKIFNNSFINTLSRGIRVDATIGVECVDMEVHHNRFINGSKGGFELRRFGRNIKAYNNVLIDSVDSSFGGSAAEKSISISGTVGVSIYENYVKQTNSDAGTIIVEYIDRQSEDVSIYGNRCYGCGENSIKVGASDRVNVYDNYSHFAAKRGLYIEGCRNAQIHHNYIYDSGRSSILLAEDGDTGRVNQNCTVSHNVLTRCNLDAKDIGTDVATAWSAGLVVTEGQTITNASKVYGAQTGGTTGGVAPTHTSGTVSDGAINWIHIGVTGSAHQDSYHLFSRGAAENTIYHHNRFIEDSLTSWANGARATDVDIEITNNDFSGLRDGVIAMRNSTATGKQLVRDNLGLNTEEAGTATILQPATTVEVEPPTVITTDFLVTLTPRTKLSGTAAYIYQTAGANNKIVIRARDASHSTPSVTTDIEVDWTWSATDAKGTFAKTT